MKELSFFSTKSERLNSVRTLDLRYSPDKGEHYTTEHNPSIKVLSMIN